MNVSVEHKLIITWGSGSHQWQPDERPIYIDGRPFIKIENARGPLARQLAKEVGIELQKDASPSLSKLPAMLLAMKLRNAADASESAKRSASKLFKRQAAKQSDDAVLQRRSRADILQRRQNPTAFDVDLPFSDGQRPLRCVRPGHPNDSLIIDMSADTIKTLFEFFIEVGFTASDLLTKREWRSSGEKGVWKRTTKQKTTYHKKSTSSSGKVFWEARVSKCSPAEADESSDAADEDRASPERSSDAADENINQQAECPAVENDADASTAV